MPIWLIPIIVLGALVLVLLALNLLARVQGGRFVRPIAQGLMKLPFVGNRLNNASRTALERQKPELASALATHDRYRATRDAMKAQQALSRLSAAGRHA